VLAKLLYTIRLGETLLVVRFDCLALSVDHLLTTVVA